MYAQHDLLRITILEIEFKLNSLGQKLDETAEKALKELPEDAPWSQKLLVKHRRLVGKYGRLIDKLWQTISR